MTIIKRNFQFGKPDHEPADLLCTVESDEATRTIKLKFDVTHPAYANTPRPLQDEGKKALAVNIINEAGRPFNTWGKWLERVRGKTPAVSFSIPRIVPDSTMFVSEVTLDAGGDFRATLRAIIEKMTHSRHNHKHTYRYSHQEYGVIPVRVSHSPQIGESSWPEDSIRAAESARREGETDQEHRERLVEQLDERLSRGDLDRENSGSPAAQVARQTLRRMFDARCADDDENAPSPRYAMQVVFDDDLTMGLETVSEGSPGREPVQIYTGQPNRGSRDYRR